MKRKTVYCHPEEGKEEFVRHLFSRHAEEWKFEIINIQKKFPDCTAIDKRGKEEVLINIEFEYSAKNYITHGHDARTLKIPTIIVCWNKNINHIEGVKEIISLKDKSYGIDIKDYPKKIGNLDTDDKEPRYYVINYNKKFAGEKEIEEWSKVSCFRVNTEPDRNKFAGNNLPKGSKILLYQEGHIIAGFTVERYAIIDRPNKKEEKKFFTLYRKLMDYPTTLYSMTEKEHKEEFWRGHIFYTDFFVFDRARPEFKFKGSGPINKITEEIYDNLVG